MEVINKSISDALEWQNTQISVSTINPVGQGPSRRSSVAPHLSPPPDTVVCYVDAASDAGSGNCGLGGLFSGHQSASRLPRLCESRPFVSSALMAEALAVRRVVMTATFTNIKRLLILSDSLTLINILRNKESRSALFGIVFDIYHFSSYFDVISFSHILRLSNCEADSIAKCALALFSVTSVGGG